MWQERRTPHVTCLRVAAAMSFAAELVLRSRMYVRVAFSTTPVSSLRRSFPASVSR